MRVASEGGHSGRGRATRPCACPGAARSGRGQGIARGGRSGTAACACASPNQRRPVSSKFPRPAPHCERRHNRAPVRDLRAASPALPLPVAAQARCESSASACAICRRRRRHWAGRPSPPSPSTPERRSLRRRLPPLRSPPPRAPMKAEGLLTGARSSSRRRRSSHRRSRHHRSSRRGRSSRRSIHGRSNSGRRRGRM